VSGVRPVAATDRVSDVLARDESLVEVFVRQSPHFAKLRSPSMRRVMARLVTVEQAARVAGVAPGVLVRELNVALGLAAEPAEASATPEHPTAAEKLTTAETSQSAVPAHPAGAAVIEVDVREDLRGGVEPFSRILAAVTRLRDHEVMRLRAPFEPVPLYAVLGKRGLMHETRLEGPGDWSVWFWRPAPGSAPAALAAAPEGPTAAPAAGTADPRTVWLDVRGLEPPEPMLRTLAALEVLPAEHTLVQVNARVPQFLLPALAERGLVWEIDHSAADHVIVRITRPSPSLSERNPTVPTTHPLELDVRPIPPREKHPAIFRTFDALAAGQAMVIINDHDPRPLRYQFQAERPESFDWAYEEEGPEVWRVRISRR
jgi:uncharacterized protein (DUF2249 family)